MRFDSNRDVRAKRIENSGAVFIVAGLRRVLCELRKAEPQNIPVSKRCLFYAGASRMAATWGVNKKRCNIILVISWAATASETM